MQGTFSSFGSSGFPSPSCQCFFWLCSPVTISLVIKAAKINLKVLLLKKWGFSISEYKNLFGVIFFSHFLFCIPGVWLQLTKFLCKSVLSGPFKDCLQALEDGHTGSGMYLVKPENANRLMQVWCDQRHDPGGWTVIQRRVDGSVNFFRNWETYKVQHLHTN